MKTLIKMTDYLPDNPYSKFLKQTPQIWMFVPCKLVNGVWSVLEEPKRPWQDSIIEEGLHERYKQELSEYQQAKERCYFEGFEVKERNCNEAKFKYIENGLIAVFYYNKTTNSFEENADFKTLEDLIPYNLTLTATAQKEIV